MIVERGFPLLRKINRLLAAMRDMGIMTKLIVDFNYDMNILESMRELKAHIASKDPLNEAFDEQAQHSKSRHEDPDIVLTVEHLEGAFTVHLMGLTISAAVFLLELFFRARLVRNFAAFLRQKICCGKKTKATKKVRFTIPKNRKIENDFLKSRKI